MERKELKLIRADPRHSRKKKRGGEGGGVRRRNRE